MRRKASGKKCFFSPWHVQVLVQDLEAPGESEVEGYLGLLQQIKVRQGRG